MGLQRGSDLVSEGVGRHEHMGLVERMRRRQKDGKTWKIRKEQVRTVLKFIKTKGIPASDDTSSSLGKSLRRVRGIPLHSNTEAEHGHACFFFSDDDHCLSQCVTGQTCLTVRGIPVQQILFSRGHDSITQVRRATFLTDVGDLL